MTPTTAFVDKMVHVLNKNLGSDLKTMECLEASLRKVVEEANASLAALAASLDVCRDTLEARVMQRAKDRRVARASRLAERTSANTHTVDSKHAHL